MTDYAAAILLAVCLLVLWMFAIDPRPEPTECGAKCFRHGARPRVHVPCVRCEDRHPVR